MQLLISISPGPGLAFTHRNNASLRRVFVHLHWHVSNSHLASAHPDSLSVRSHWTCESLSTTRILLVHFTFPFSFPLETAFHHFFSIPVFYLFSLSLSPSLLQTQQRDTHRKTFVVALTLFHPTTKQQTNRWKKRRVMVWGILIYQIKP